MKKPLLISFLLALFAFATPSLAQDAPMAENAVITSININDANMEQLSMLTGIGSAKAKAIVAYRDTNGPFNSVDDLANVSGIGPATVEKNRHLLSK